MFNLTMTFNLTSKVIARSVRIKKKNQHFPGLGIPSLKKIYQYSRIPISVEIISTAKFIWLHTSPFLHEPCCCCHTIHGGKRRFLKSMPFLWSDSVREGKVIKETSLAAPTASVCLGQRGGISLNSFPSLPQVCRQCRVTRGEGGRSFKTFLSLPQAQVPCMAWLHKSHLKGTPPLNGFWNKSFREGTRSTAKTD